MAGPNLLLQPIAVQPLDKGAIWLVTLNAPKGNVLDRAMGAALTDTFLDAAERPNLCAIVLTGAGDHFSFGASVKEHLPGEVDQMLPEFHRLIVSLFDASIPTLAAVRGQCLGGGMELALACQRIIASPEAKFGQPEVNLGVFAPVASLLLPERVGRARAEELCLTGRVIAADEASRIGLVDSIAPDPVEAALDWVRANLLSKSASSLRLALRALRQTHRERFVADLERLERLYLTDLMATHDATEGLKAFLEKRPAQWRNG